MKLINKDALVAEINRRIKEHHSGYLVCLKDILSFLDTLEVKEVDLEEEVKVMLGRGEIRQILSFIWKEDNSVGKKFFNYALQIAKIVIDSMQEQKFSNVERNGKEWKEPVSEDSDNAARDYADTCKLDNDTNFFERQLCVEHFKAGANWYKEQIMSKAMKG